MFVGRNEELSTLEKAYAADGFQMAVLYGRRRVGKTALLEHFSMGKPCLFFTAQLQSDRDNRSDFSRLVYASCDMPLSTPPFASWLDAFAFLAQRKRQSKFIIIFDEFPYAARSDSSLPSALQVAIDRHLKATNIFLILSGSNQGFMENEVLGEKSPLYGRRTCQIKLRPFDYLDASLMMPHCSPWERLSYYAAFGGTPYYLSAISKEDKLIDNIINLYFSRAGIMFDEPAMLMRQELREPSTYVSILRAIADGAGKSNEISSRAGVANTAITGYLRTLIALDLVERVVPIGESRQSRHARYRIKDPAFLFWYRFVSPFVAAVEGGTGPQVARRLFTSDLHSEYEGHIFERVCRQWIQRRAVKDDLPIQVTEVGSWWGTDPMSRTQTDIDVVAVDQIEKKALLGECKWRNQINESEVLSMLMDRKRLVQGFRDYWFYVFTKMPVGEQSARRASDLGFARYVSIEEIYQ